MGIAESSTVQTGKEDAKAKSGHMIICGMAPGNARGSKMLNESRRVLLDTWSPSGYFSLLIVSDVVTVVELGACPSFESSSSRVSILIRYALELGRVCHLLS